MAVVVLPSYPMESHELLPKSLIYYPAFFTPQKADELFFALQELPWKQESITLFGKTIPQPRLTLYYGTAPYTYSRKTFHPTPYPPCVLQLLDAISPLATRPFNSVLLNYYRDGKDYMGWHSDDEKELGPNPEILSVSFGASRVFRFKNNHAEKGEITLHHGDVIVMKNSFQRDWKHEIKKETKPCDPRINLTFRRVME